MKELSDSIYLDQVQDENAQTKKNTTFDEMDESMLRTAPSPEDLFIGEMDAQAAVEHRQRKLEMANRALEILTDVQRRRYLLYRLDGLTMRQIADMEGVVHSKIQKSIESAEKKIKKFLASAKNTPKK